MIRLVKYSFRMLSLTVVVFMAVNYGTLPYPVYICAPLSLIPWLIFDLILPEEFARSKCTGIILESVSVFSAILLLNAYLFSGFLTIVFFYILKSWRFKTAILVNIFLIFILAIVDISISLKADLLIALIPVITVSILLYRTSMDSESDLRKEIEDQQIQIDGKNKLLSTLSHELRTPLAVIKTSTEILLEERPGTVNSTQRRFLTAVKDNTLRMIRLVDSILASIKVEYAWFRMKKKAKDIRPIIKKVCNDLEPFIQSRGQSLKYRYPSLLSKTVIDENWIQQVLINLIHNASKHVGEKGRIIVSVNENEPCVVVSVSDDGSGIVNNDKPKVFSEFYQGQGSQDGGELSETDAQGVGLGLSIVKNVIEKHGGNVYVSSVAGLGTSLSFTLPKVAE